MFRKKLFSLFFGLLLGGFLFGQKEYNVWYFGAYAGIDFNSGTPVEITNSAMHSLEGCATICDKNGNILFYSDGDTIWNRNHAPMSNGTDLLGDHSATQAVKIIRKPGSTNLYYVFTLDNYCEVDGLTYSVVDMSLNGGLGDVSATKNVFLHAPTSEKITVAKQQNGMDYWIITHKCLSDSFMVYSLTSFGLNHTPVVSTVGPNVLKYNGDVGQLKISPDGTKIAFAGQKTTCQLMFFDKINGWVLNSIDLSLPENGCYGIEFSPNSNLLYVNTNEAVGGNRIPRLYQFDVSSGVQGIIQATRTFISTSNSDRYLSLQLAPDGKIYQAKNNYPVGSQYLGVINNPDLPGTACNYADYGFKLNGGGLCLFGLPDYSLQSIDTNATSLTASLSHTEISCYGDKTASATVTPISGTPGYTYSWFPSGSTDSMAINLGAGTHTITVTDANNNVYIDSVIIDQPSSLTLNPLSDQSICLGDSIIFSVLVSGGVPGYTYSWNSGISSDSVYIAKPATTTSYTIEVSDQNNCKTSDTVELEVVASITAKVTPDTTICEGDSIVLTASGGSTYSWNTGATTNSITVQPNSTTTYTVSVASGSCSPDQATTTITTAPPPSITITGDTLICIGDSAILTASGGTNYLWYNGESNTSITIHPSMDTVYAVLASAGSCWTSKSITVKLTDPPVISINGITEVCLGDTTSLSVSGAGSYQWSNGATSSSIDVSPPLSTDYFVTAFDGSCKNTDSIRVNVIPSPTVDAGSDQSICSGDHITLYPTTTGTAYQWNTGETSLNLNVSPTTTTTYTITVTKGTCKAVSDEVTVNIVSEIIVKAGNDTSICKGDTIQLYASGGSSFEWSHGAMTQSTAVSPSNNTTYSVIGKSGTCDPDTDQVIVTVIEVIADAGSDKQINSGQSVTLNGSGGGTYQWQPGMGLDNSGIANPVASPSVTTTYTLTVIDQYGCIARDVITISVDEICGKLFIPNAFSPNGDGVNDVLYVRGFCIESLNFAIFNRWGEKVFESTDPEKGWDGIYHGSDNNSVSFDYTLKATLTNGTTIEQQGTITLLR